MSAIAACSTCAVALLLGWRCRVLGVALRRSHELRQAERQGRTEAEKRLRQLRTSFRGKDDGSVQGGAAQPGPSASEADDVFSSSRSDVYWHGGRCLDVLSILLGLPLDDKKSENDLVTMVVLGVRVALDW